MAESKKTKETYYLVREDVMPDVFIKLMEVNRRLDLKRVPSVNVAVKPVGISRSAYYKYRKAIRSTRSFTEGAMTTMLIAMESLESSAQRCFEAVLNSGATLVSFQQSPPVDGLIHMLITFRTDDMTESMDVFVHRLSQTRGIVEIRPLRLS